jgi:hypothetical protein
VAVAIEVPHGPVVDALQDRGFAVHAINPKQLDRLRDRFSVAGAKDDRRDARIAAAGLRTDPQLFRPARIGDPWSLSCASGRGWRRSCSRSACDLAIVFASNCGVTIRNCSNSPTTSPPSGSWSCG